MNIHSLYKKHKIFLFVTGLFVPVSSLAVSTTSDGTPKGEYKTKIKGRYFLSAGTYVNLGRNTLLQPKGTIEAGMGVNVNGNLMLEDDPDNQTGERGGLYVTRKKATPITINVTGNWFGENVKSETNPTTLYLASQWETGTDTETNTGLISDMVTIGGNVYGYTLVKVIKPQSSNYEEPDASTNTITDLNKTFYAIQDGKPLITIGGKIEHENSFYGFLPLADGTQVQLVPYEKDGVKGFTWGWVKNPNNGGTDSISDENATIRTSYHTLRFAANALSSSWREREGETYRISESEQCPVYLRILHARQKFSDNQQLEVSNKVSGIEMGIGLSHKPGTTAKTYTEDTKLILGYANFHSISYDNAHIAMNIQPAGGEVCTHFQTNG
ncbi:hypothetical protein [Avibacterium paragallinarum]|uniref:Uncharacterized protein n=1 Tax=Avibacterium paragallinarum TaxID=728 RepID=A0A377IBV6_AVIPA|nr:hypothetical protein [Avibacterium paragallinarum]RZN78065.1 hypothetical protein EC523_00055 [Avibacterium paragallinarum]CDF98431.1 Hypothetical protein AJF4211_001710 [Avibacterium paragallinarum JF4211]STO72805.1 Uncharacterised protein [Avibacterium paragallinarum]